MLHIALCGISHQDEELLNMLQAYAPHPRETAPATTHFNSAEQLLAGLKRGCFDLILIQLSLPDMDGIELAHSIHQQGYRIPVVFLADGPSAPWRPTAPGRCNIWCARWNSRCSTMLWKSLPALGASRKAPAFG